MKKNLFILVPIVVLSACIAIIWASMSLTTSSAVPSNINLTDNWTMVNHDLSMTRNSPQTDIGKGNVGQLQAKWILNTGYPVESSPLIVGDTGYAQNNAMQIIAFDLKTGLTKWKYDPRILVNGTLPEVTMSHGMTYDNGSIFAPLGPKKAIVALNASDGSVIWLSSAINNSESYRVSAPPVVWKNYIIVGSALGDEPPFTPAAKGTVTALDRTNGSIIWQIPTAIGEWVSGDNADKNGGATVWSGGALDTEKGIIYLPVGNPAPDFTNETRSMECLYSNHMIAVNISDGKVLWATPFIAQGTVLNVTIPDTHDWDTAWGSNLVTVKDVNGTHKVVIGHDKRGDIIAMDAETGKPLWWTTVGYVYRDDVEPSVNGSGEVWPGVSSGVQDYSAVDDNTLYVAVSNTALDYFMKPNDTEGYVKPYFDAMPNGIGNGSIIALDLMTGKVKWEYPTEYPTWVSPLVSNGIVFSGHVTATGKPYKYNIFAGPTETPLIPSGIIMALDKDTGEKLWEYNVGAPVGIGGPSIGQGLLLVPTGSPSEMPANMGGYIVAFGLPG